MTPDEERAKRITRAQQDIANILAKLERETDMLVKSLRIAEVNLTSFSDDKPIYAQCVQIEMYRLPGHQWGETK